MAKTSKDISESTLTRMQELGSAWVFKRAIQDNAVWSSWEEIKEDVDTYDEIKKIWIKVGGVMWCRYNHENDGCKRQNERKG